MRTATAVGHRLIVESPERMVPGRLGCRSTGDFLIGTPRISAADAARRVTGAKKTGTWHSLDGEQVDPQLPATAAAQRAGAIGPDHVAAVARPMRKVPYGAGIGESTVAEKILADAACSVTPEEVTKLGAHLLAYLNPDGDIPDEKERRRRRGLRIGKQGTDLITPISGLLDPETRALLEPILAKPARPGMNNPDDPDSPRGDVEPATLDRDALAKATARDTRTAGQRNHDWKDGGAPPTSPTRTSPATPATHSCTRDPAAGKRESHQQSRSIRAAPTGSRPRTSTRTGHRGSTTGTASGICWPRRWRTTAPAATPSCANTGDGGCGTRPEKPVVATVRCSTRRVAVAGHSSAPIDSPRGVTWATSLCSRLSGMQLSAAAGPAHRRHLAVPNVRTNTEFSFGNVARRCPTSSSGTRCAVPECYLP